MYKDCVQTFRISESRKGVRIFKAMVPLLGNVTTHILTSLIVAYCNTYPNVANCSILITLALTSPIVA